MVCDPKHSTATIKLGSSGNNTPHLAILEINFSMPGDPFNLMKQPI